MGKVNCGFCNKFMGFTIGLGYHPNGNGAEKSADGTWCCSSKCARDYNIHRINTGSGNSSSSKSSGKSFVSSFVDDDDDKRPKTSEEIAAEERQRKEVAESDARFFDGFKKLFMGGKNKAAKELHSKLEEIESDIRVAISKGDKDKAGELIRQLKHDSTFFVSGTNVTYSKYWADKREECLNKL